jgi:hypothetical protein
MLIWIANDELDVVFTFVSYQSGITYYVGNC